MPFLNVEITEELLREFRVFAVAKHGKVYGALRPEVELALRSYLDVQGTSLQENKMKYGPILP